MESPRHGALDPGSHPRTNAEAAHPGASGHRNTIQMYVGMHTLDGPVLLSVACASTD